MDFNHPTQHSIENLEKLEAKLAGGQIKASESLGIASRLASHAHPATEQIIAALRDKVRHPQVLRQVDFIARGAANVRRAFRFETMTAQARKDFYKREGFILLRKKGGSSNLLVVFATMFNNFHYSTAALVNMLCGLDCNILVLKDSSLMNYHHGVAGFAGTIPEIAIGIDRIARQENAERVLFTGFSSCGYAALLTSLMTRCDGYLGFSQPTDLGGNSHLPSPLYFTPKVRAAVDQTHLVDLRPLLVAADPAVRRTFVYGSQNLDDSAHARHLEGIAHLDIVALPQAAHNTIECLVAGDALLPLFAQLISGRYPTDVKLISGR